MFDKVLNIFLILERTPLVFKQCLQDKSEKCYKYHCEKYRHFTLFPGVEILRKDKSGEITVF